MLVHWEGFDTRGEAMKREKHRKQGAGARVKAELLSDFLGAGGHRTDR